MDHDRIQQLVRLVGQSGIARLELTEGDTHLLIVGTETPAPLSAPSAVNNAFVAPMAGVYYSAPSTGADPFVAVGDRVEQGHPLCILEAMKMLTTIAAPRAGRITRIIAQNGQSVEVDQPLFEIDWDVA